MPEALLKFRLPEEVNEFTMAHRGSAYYGALWDFSMHLRNRIKYGQMSDEARDAVEKVRDEFHQILESCNVDLEEVS